MPLYCYSCPACSVETEQMFKMSEKPREIPCPSCGAPAHSILPDRLTFVIHDVQVGKLYGMKKKLPTGEVVVTTKGANTTIEHDGKLHSYSRYYLKNNPDQDPRIIRAKNEREASKNSK